VRCDLLAPQGTPSLPLLCPHCMVSRPRPRYRRRGRVSSDAARPVGAATEELLVPLEDRHSHYLVGYEEEDREHPVVCGRVQDEPDFSSDLSLAIPTCGDRPTFGFAWLHATDTGTTPVALFMVSRHQRGVA
jgi:hypothetical protein